MDIGVYPVSLVRVIAGTRAPAFTPSRAGASGVDRALAATLEFPSGLLAQLTCSFEACTHRQALIAGAQGVIETSFSNHTADASQAVLKLRVGTNKDAVDSTVQTSAVNGFLAEAESFESLVRRGPVRWAGTTPEESIDNMLTLDAIRRSARSDGAGETP